MSTAAIVIATAWVSGGLGFCIGVLAAGKSEPSDDNLPKCPASVPEWMVSE